MYSSKITKTGSKVSMVVAIAIETNLIARNQHVRWAKKLRPENTAHFACDQDFLSSHGLPIGKTSKLPSASLINPRANGKASLDFLTSGPAKLRANVETARIR
jgi:hypothetical protein